MLNRLVKLFIISIALKFSSANELTCNLSRELIDEIKGYQGVVDHIVKEITEGRFKGKTFDALQELTDTFGSRMSCSENYERAIDYAVEKMKESNLENVHTEKVLNIPNWKRGKIKIKDELKIIMKVKIIRI